MSLLAIQNINLASLADTTVSLATAFILGGLIGFERQYRQRTAGLRTNVLVALSSAIFVDLANHLGGTDGAIHVVAYIVSGIGFLGAGVIMREDGNVRGLNTAATLWGSAAIGACAGADMILEAILGTLFVLATNTMLRPVVNIINDLPINSQKAELNNTVYLIAQRTHQKEALHLLETSLKKANCEFRSLSIHAFGNDAVTIEAMLMPTSVIQSELDQITHTLAEQPCVIQAFWSPNTSD